MQRQRQNRQDFLAGDVVQAGFVVSNSEVGLGSLRVEALVFRLVCKSGLICKDLAQKKYHVGRQVNTSDDSAYELYSDMREATQIPLKHDPVKAVELLADKFQLTENERGDILRQLFMQGDNSRYGLFNAVTAASKRKSRISRA